MISLILNALGLMTESEHYRRVEVLEDILDETRAAEQLLLARNGRQAATIINYRDKLQIAEGDANELRSTFNQRLADAVQDYQHDANMWRNSLKRSRDRKKGVANG